MSICEIAQANATKWMPAPPASEDAIIRSVRAVGFDYHLALAGLW
jgi:hypothetical protein